QRQRLTPPPARHGPYPPERGVWGGAQAWDRGEWAGGGAQGGELWRPRQVRGRTPRAVGEQPGGRPRGPDGKGAAVRGQATDHPQACGPLGGRDALGWGRPAPGAGR